MVQVGILMGSASDENTISPCIEVLKKLGVSYRFTVSSAHRTPIRTEKIVDELEKEGCQVFICAAGMAAHLAGAVAARTIKPVIGIPVTGSALNGLDALLATVQMPPGFPVGTVALDKAGAKNAAYMAAQIIAIHDKNVAKALEDERQVFRDVVEKTAKEIEEKYQSQ